MNKSIKSADLTIAENDRLARYRKKAIDRVRAELEAAIASDAI
jgi:hypothetical protein